MGRSPCCDKSKVKRGAWSPEEDAALTNYLQNHGTRGNWIALPHKAGLQRCGKSCRLRWLNYLRPDLKHGAFTQEEESTILSLYNEIGSRWSVIASRLPGRTDNDVKNYWNTKLKKKLVAPKTAAAASKMTAATTRTTGAPTTTLDKTTSASTSLLPSPPFEPDNVTLPSLILEGSSNCSSEGLTLQDSSPFKTFSSGADANYGVDNKEITADDPYDVLSALWTQDEGGLGADNNADLFSMIFRVDSKPQD